MPLLLLKQLVYVQVQVGNGNASNLCDWSLFGLGLFLGFFLQKVVLPGSTERFDHDSAARFVHLQRVLYVE